MSVAGLHRASAAHGTGRGSGLVQERPLRYPDASSRTVMSRRAIFLVVMNFLVPGSAQVLAGSRRLGRFGLVATITTWIVALLGLLAAVLWPQVLYAVGTNVFLLTLIQIALVGYVVLWIVLTIDTLRLVRLVKTGPLARVGVTVLSIALLVVAGGSASYGAQVTGSARDALGTIFDVSGPPVEASDGYYNILLLGADSGDGRDSMRFDSISVVSINADTGAVTITGIPRDLVNAPFSEGPMQTLYPDGHTGHADATCGWGSGINQIRTEVEVCRDGDALYPDAVAQGSSPGVEATKDAAEGILGIQIPYYVFLDMNGFAALIDALGGVDITVAQRLPKGWGPLGNEPPEVWAKGWIEPGAQHMDGDTAQWYARSRYTTNDWDRMERQRQLQTAILAQFSPANVLARFQDIAKAGSNLIETDIPQSLLPYLVDLGVKAKDQPVQTIELTPANGIEEREPDFALVHEMVQEKLHPPTPTPTPTTEG